MVVLFDQISKELIETQPGDFTPVVTKLTRFECSSVQVLKQLTLTFVHGLDCARTQLIIFGQRQRVTVALNLGELSSKEIFCTFSKAWEEIFICCCKYGWLCCCKYGWLCNLGLV